LGVGSSGGGLFLGLTRLDILKSQASGMGLVVEKLSFVDVQVNTAM
jgi:hypothetical protein